MFFIALLVAHSTVSAETSDNKPFLNGLFTDHMVLQRDMKVPVWGWAEPGQRIAVSLNGKTAKAVADKEGRWMARLGSFAAGGPYTMTVTGPQTVVLRDVLIGDVWICSGQSNMEMGIGMINAPDEIANASHPQLRLYTVPKKIATQPEATVNSQWLVCTPQTVSTGGWGGFSAAGYFFGRDLHRDLSVPIGLIHTSWGGTVAEAWTSASALKLLPDFAATVEEMQQVFKQGPDAMQKLVEEWYQKNDPGSTQSSAWSDPSFNDRSWKKMELPAAWESAGLPGFDGVVWFRRTVELPESWAGKDLILHLGPIDDRDTTYFNGAKVGAMDLWNLPRNYRIPGQLVKSGRNVIAVRVLDTGGAGGILGKAEEMKLEPAGGSQPAPISLSGPWEYQEAVPLAKTKSTPPTGDSNNPNIVTVLYNGMIAPLEPFGIKGAIWYQGESNAGRGRQYRELLPAMIRDWRSRFREGNFPFLIVQLANFTDQKPEPSDSAWAEIREAQLMAAEKLPKTGLAVAIDIGEARDIHPKNKQEVGRRLELAALAIAYGKKIEYSGPIYRSMKIDANKIRLRFDHAKGGLVARGGGKLEGFAIAGEDKHFVWADAAIEGNSVVVSSPQVVKPVAVRYAWADNPVCNLYNQTGLPASPFRTDSK